MEWQRSGKSRVAEEYERLVTLLSTERAEELGVGPCELCGEPMDVGHGMSWRHMEAVTAFAEREIEKAKQKLLTRMAWEEHREVEELREIEALRKELAALQEEE